MGEVLLAREATLGREVALKRILPEKADQLVLQEHFEREARITAQLDHPGIVPVYEMIRQPDGALAYTMKVVRGQTLAALTTRAREAVLAKGVVPEALRLPARLAAFVKCCEAVHYAHERGFLHRDLKPANIMLGPFSEVYVMDWGIARPIDRPDSVEEARALVEGEGGALHLSADDTAIVLGTPRYMAPEQARGEQTSLGPASDQYALGLILQELVTLDVAIPGSSPATLISFASDGVRRSPRVTTDGSRPDAELHAIIERACSLDPTDRYPSVRAMAADVTRYLGGRAVETRPDTPYQATARWFSQNKQITMLVLVGLLTTLFASSTLFLLWQRAQREAAQAREAALTTVLTQAGERSHFIYEHLLVYEGLVNMIGASTLQALAHPPDPAATTWRPSDVAAGRVPGLRPSVRYGQAISPYATVQVPAPGVSPEALASVTRQMASTTRTFVNAASQSALAAGQTLDDLDEPEGELHLPLSAAYVGLAAGLHVSWPAKGGYPDDYDPRDRPWYVETVADPSQNARWHSPYVDALGQGVVLPCTLPLHDNNGTLLGVVGVELTMGMVMDELLALSVPGVRSVWLLDRDGRVLAPRTEGDAPLEPYPLQPIVDAVREGKSGWQEGLGPAADTLAIYYTLGDEGLAYVVEGETAALLRGAEANRQ